MWFCGSVVPSFLPSVTFWNITFYTYILYGKTLPLFLSDIFSQIKCLSLHSNIFMQISNVLNFFDFNFFDFNDRWSIINDLQWSMVFNDHSILLHRDYYWLIMDYNHDFGLRHIVPGRDFGCWYFWLELFRLQWSMIFNDPWYSMIIQFYCTGIITD